jgi:hypothetical protein
MAFALPDLAAFRTTVESLSARLEALEQARPEGHLVPVDPCDTLEITERVKALTRDIFSSEATVTVGKDPEYHDRSFIVSVACGGSIDEIVAKSDRWHRQLHLAAKNLTPLYSLSIIPHDAGN